MSRFIEVAVGDNDKPYNMCISLDHIVYIKPDKNTTFIKLIHHIGANDFTRVHMEYDVFIDYYIKKNNTVDKLDN